MQTVNLGRGWRLVAAGDGGFHVYRGRRCIGSVWALLDNPDDFDLPRWLIPAIEAAIYEE